MPKLSHTSKLIKLRKFDFKKRNVKRVLLVFLLLLCIYLVDFGRIFIVLSLYLSKNRLKIKKNFSKVKGDLFPALLKSDKKNFF